MITQRILIWLDAISPLLLLLFVSVNKKVIGWKDCILLFVASQAILNSIADILDQVIDAHNLYLYHINCAVSFILLSLYFKQTLTIKKISPITITTLVIFLLFFIIDIIHWENFDTFNSNSLGLASFILIGYCFLYYLKQILQPTTISITKSKDFWYVTGIFTYYASNFFIFISYNWLTQNGAKLDLIWKTHNVILLIMCIYIFIGFKCKPTQTI